MVTRSTTYAVKNNSDYDVPTLYIEHKAGTEHDGFIIKTETELKSVTGFSRFGLSLKAHTEEVFEVEEEANYEEKLAVSKLAMKATGSTKSCIHKLETFLKERAKALEQQGVLSRNQRNFMKKKLLEAEKRQVLLDLKANPDIDETYVRKLEKKSGVLSTKSSLFKTLVKLTNLKVELETVQEKVRLAESMQGYSSGGLNKNVESMSKRKQEAAAIKSKVESVKFDLQTLATQLLDQENDGQDINSLVQ